MLLMLSAHLEAQVSNLTFTASTLYAGYNTNATVTLATPAPAQGYIALLTCPDTNIAFPTRVDVPSGQTTVAFRVSTNPVNAVTTSQLTATGQGSTLSATAGTLLIMDREY